MEASMQDWNQQVMAEFRANGGKVGAFGDNPVLLLHTVGAKSGAERVTPLCYLPEGDSLHIFASKAGAPTHPAWYHNLRANPSARIELGTEARDGIETHAVVATEVIGSERDRLYAAQVAAMPQFAEYEEKTDRKIPVVALRIVD